MPAFSPVRRFTWRAEGRLLVRCAIYPWPPLPWRVMKTDNPRGGLRTGDEWWRLRHTQCVEGVPLRRASPPREA